MSRDWEHDRKTYDSSRQVIVGRIITERRRKTGHRRRSAITPHLRRYCSKVCSYHRARFRCPDSLLDDLTTCPEREVVPKLKEFEQDVKDSPGGQVNAYKDE